MDDRRRRQAVRREAVEDLLQVVDRPQVDAEQVAVLACYSVTFADLGRPSCDLGDPLELARRRADTDDRGHGETERSRDLRALAATVARALGRSDRTARRTVVGLAVVFAAMNVCFYVAIDRLPLGTVAAIEFLPVIALAALGAGTGRNAAALGLAVIGVYLLTDVRLEGEPVGLAFAFANAALFANYIVLAHRLARSETLGRLDGLAAAMLLAAIVVTPVAGWSAVPAFADPVAVAAGIGVGLASSVIPYVFDQLAMARLSRATYSLMVSLLPATATVVGIVVLAQIPTAIELTGVVLVALAVAAHRERRPEPQRG